MSKHEEFPMLAEDALAAFQAGCAAAPFPWAVGQQPKAPDRRFLAGFLREAINRADSLGIYSLTLEGIADNLHNPSPPPPPPTLAQAREADLESPAGRDVVRDFLATLGEVQP